MTSDILLNKIAIFITKAVVIIGSWCHAGVGSVVGCSAVRGMTVVPYGRYTPESCAY